MWDEVAAGVLLDPTLVVHPGELAMDIDVSHGPTYGSTLSWPKGHGPGLGEPEVTVAFAVDVPRLEKLFIDQIGRTTPTGK
jgi:inosine-uridine nucleoside N-ribohydrolase